MKRFVGWVYVMKMKLRFRAGRYQHAVAYDPLGLESMRNVAEALLLRT